MKPLSKTKRTFMLSLLSLAFIIFVPLLLLYSTGYRFDNSFQIVKTGGIFLHSSSASTSVYLDDEFIEDNGLILRNTLIQDLTPNESYRIAVLKEDFHNWEKYLFVLPNLVTEANVLLWPSEVEFIEIQPTILVSSSPAVVDEEGVEIPEEELPEIEEIELDNPEYLILETFFEEGLEQFEQEVAIKLPGVPLPQIEIVKEYPEYIEQLGIVDIDDFVSLKEKNRHLARLEEGNVVVNWIGEEDNTPFYFCNTECSDEIIVDIDKDILAYDFLPGRDDVLVLLTSDGVYVREIDQRTQANMYPVLEKENLEMKVRDNSTIFIKDGDIFLEVQ